MHPIFTGLLTLGWFGVAIASYSQVDAQSVS
ncbi:hypothetical protein FHS85_005329, partial [Rhodoligotrophos appendicifer]